MGSVKYVTSLIHRVKIVFILVDTISVHLARRTQLHIFESLRYSSSPSRIRINYTSPFSREKHNFVIPSGVITAPHLRHHRSKKTHHVYDLWRQKAKELHNTRDAKDCQSSRYISRRDAAFSFPPLTALQYICTAPTNFTCATSVALCHRMVGISRLYV
jgi:hypothetical protein